MRAILAVLIIPLVSSQIFPGSYELNPRGQSESGSSVTGNCSNVSDSGRVCNTPLTSVLFDGIPTLPGLDGDMWASQLLILNTSTSSATITFNFNGATNTNGAELDFYTGIETMEVVIFNCPSRGIGVNTIEVLGDNNPIDNIIMPESCNSLVIGCVDTSLTTSARLISLEFSNMMLTPYIAEITFYSSSARVCAPTGPVDPMVTTTTASIPTTSADTTVNMESSVSESMMSANTPMLSTEISTSQNTTSPPLPSSSFLTAIIATVIVIVIAIAAIGIILVILLFIIWRRKRIGKGILTESTQHSSSNVQNELAEYATIGDTDNKLSTLTKSSEPGKPTGTTSIAESSNRNLSPENSRYSRLNRDSNNQGGIPSEQVTDVYATINKSDSSNPSSKPDSAKVETSGNLYSPMHLDSSDTNEPKEEAPPIIPDKSKDLEIYLDNKTATLKANASKQTESDDIYTVPSNSGKVSSLSRNAIPIKSYSDNPMYASMEGMDDVYSEPQFQKADSDFTNNPQMENIYESIYSESIQPSSFMKSEEIPSHDDLCPYSSIYTMPVIPSSPEKPLEVSPSNIQQEKKLGSGQFGLVILARTVGLSQADLRIGASDNRSASIHVAIKTLRNDASEATKMQFEKEYRFMFRLNHPNVIRMLGICMEGTPFIMMEYMGNGDLNQFLNGRYTSIVECDGALNNGEIHLSVLIHICTQIASGMNYLSSNNFVHRDIATRNCLVGDNFAIKIADFGMSRSLYESHYYIIRGHAILPIRWMASECFYGKFSAMTDVWAFGCTMWEVFVLSKFEPYFEMTDQELVQNAILGQARTMLSCPKYCPNAIYDIMKLCWVHDASERATFEQLHYKLASF